MELDGHVTIPTPEGTDVVLVVAGLGSRALATMVDVVIQGAVFYALFTLVALAVGITGSGIAADSDSEAVVVALVAIMTFVVLFGYHVAFEVLGAGRSPGKRTMGLRVVDEQGGPVRFRASAIRNLVRIADLLPGLYGIGMVTIVLHPRSQRLGDIAAGTLVVRDRRAVTPTPLAAPAILHGHTPYPPAGWVPSRPGGGAPLGWSAGSGPGGAAGAGGPLWDLSAVSDAEADVVRQFLMRRWKLRADARAHLAAGLVERIAPRIPGVAPGTPSEWLLEHVALSLDARR